MKRVIAITGFGLLLLVNPPANAGKLEKVSWRLENLYNLYYDPAYLEEYLDSLNKIKVIRTAVGAELLPPNADMKFRKYGPDNVPVHFVEGIPYIKTFIRYRGDGSDLRAVGATVHSHLSEDVALVDVLLPV